MNKIHDHKPLFNNLDSNEDNVSVLRAKDRKCGVQSFAETQHMCSRCQALIDAEPWETAGSGGWRREGPCAQEAYILKG